MVHQRKIPFTLYRVFAGEELLYVGITMSPKNRFSQHEYTSEWWDWVTHFTIEHLGPDEKKARALETKAIREELPLLNLRGADCAVQNCRMKARHILFCSKHFWAYPSMGYRFWSIETVKRIKSGEHLPELSEEQMEEGKRRRDVMRAKTQQASTSYAI